MQGFRSADRRAWLCGALCALLAAACGRMTTEERLAAMWQAYLANYVSADGYAVDPLRDGRVTSEAQSYALLQAAWLRDRDAFDRTLRWTDAHLRREDGLYSWLWDPAKGGHLVDVNTATDADTDIAFALIIAADAFGEPRYRDQAAAIVAAIRQHASLPIGGAWFPSAGNWAGPERVVNLSYFAPYAYARFDALDPHQGWLEAIEVGYALLEASTRGRPARLPADFFVVDEDGVPVPLPGDSTLSRRFSFDGIRIPWRIEMDCRLRGEPRACGPQRIVQRLRDLHRHRDGLVTAYSVGGAADSTQESLSFYGALLPVLDRTAHDDAQGWRRTRLSDRQLRQLQAADNRYYDANWVWFGLALADGFILDRTPATNEPGRQR